MTNKFFIPKDHPDLPDSYAMKVHYLDGKTEEFDVAAMYLSNDRRILDFCTKDDVWHWLVMSNVKRLEFDKGFSKLVAIAKESGGKGK